jgi:cell division protein FtsB
VVHGSYLGIRWDRVGRVALLAVLAVILLLYISPASQWFSRSSMAGDQRAELQALEREHERLTARAEDLRRPEAVEREARRLGMVRRGERPYVVENLPHRTR